MIPWWAWIIFVAWCLVWGFLSVRVWIQLEKRRRHQHDFVPVAVSQYGGGAFAIATGTHVLLRCSCGKLSTQSLSGRWTMPDVLGTNRLERIQGRPTIVNEPPLAENWMKTESARRAGESVREWQERVAGKPAEVTKE